MTISRIHDDIIKCMMTSGNDSIISNQRDVFLKSKTNFLVRVQIYISIDLLHDNEFPFINFVKPLETLNGFLLITSDLMIESVNKVFFQSLLFNNITIIPPLLKIKVLMCIPMFERYLEEMKNNNLNYMDKTSVNFMFPSRTHPLMKSLIKFA
jgi:hypothetical protein